MTTLHKIAFTGLSTLLTCLWAYELLKLLTLAVAR